MTVLGPTPPRFPIGIDDYARLRADGYTYVDKTTFIAEVLDSGAVSLLLPRPRRFGKTLNMSTLRWFLERDPRESGHSRADVLGTPRTAGPGVVLGLKVIDKRRRETSKAVLKSAVEQLRSRDYAAEVRAAGAIEVHQYGVVFDGKRCWVAVA